MLLILMFFFFLIRIFLWFILLFKESLKLLKNKNKKIKPFIEIIIVSLTEIIYIL